MLAPHHAGARTSEVMSGLKVLRYRYFLPESGQQVAYPAILPNIRRRPALGLQIPFLLFAQYRAAKSVVENWQPSVVYAHWVMPQGLIAWVLKRRLGIPYILQNHSSDLSVFARLGRLGRLLARSILRDCEHFFCVNTTQKEYALSLLPSGERERFSARCSVLPMGIAGVSNFVAATESKFDIATIARLSRKKGLNFLIEAAELLARRGVRPRIGIAGDGEDRAELEAMVKDADITFTGFITGKSKDEFFSKSLTFAFPSRAFRGDVEGLPVALLEALCSGHRVLASKDTNIEQLAEWPKIKSDVTFVDDPADIPSLSSAMERLLAAAVSPSGVASLISRYQWTSLINEYLGAIDAALANRQH